MSRAPVPSYAWRPTVVTLLSLYAFLTYWLPSRLVFVGPLGAVGRPSLLLGIGLLIIWLLWFVYPRDDHRAQPVRWMILAYVGVWLASLVVAYRRGLSGIEAAGADRFLLYVMSLAGVALLAADHLRTRDELDVVLRRVTFGAAFFGLIGTIQFVTGVAPLQAIDFPLLRTVDGGFVGLGSRGSGDFVRAVSTMSHSIEYGVVSAVLFPLSVHYALAAPPGERRKRWVIAALTVVGVPFSLTRSGVVAVALGIFVLLRAWNPRARRSALIVLLGSLVLLRGAVPGLLGTFRSFFLNATSDNSVTGRTDDLPLVGELFSQRPWLGLGGGTFRPEEYFFLDNYILNALVSTGVLGLFTVLMLFLGTYGLCIRMSRRLASFEDRSLSVALAAGVLAGFGSSFTFDSLNFRTFGGTLFLLVGAAGALWRLKDSRLDAEREARYASMLKTRADAWPFIHRYLVEPEGRSPVGDSTSGDRARVEAPARPPLPPEPAAEASPLLSPPERSVLPAMSLQERAGGPEPGTDAESTPAGSRRSFAHGLRWSMVMNVGQQLGNLAVTFVLAALLGPRAFGVIAMATVFIGLVQLVVQQGMAAAIVQRERLDDRDLDTAFWLLTATSTVMAGACLAAAPWWARLNDLPELRWVIAALSPLILFRALLIVPDALLRRRMDFRPLALRTNFSVVVGGVAGIVAALAGWGVGALVVQQLVAGLVELVVVWAAVSWRPHRRFSRRSARSLVSFTAPSMAGSIAVFVQTRADALIAGLFFGPTAVGLYRFASRLVHTATGSIIASVRAVALPDLARLQSEPAALRARVVEVVRLVAAAVSVPLAALAAAAPAIIELIGPEWSGAVPAVVILSAGGVVQAVASMNTPALQAIGRPGALAALSWIGAVFSATTLLVVGALLGDADVRQQVVALAIATSGVTATVVVALTGWILARLVGVRVVALLGAAAPAVIAGGIGFAAGACADLLAAHQLGPLLRTAVVGAVAGLAAIGVLVWRIPWLRSALSRRARAAAPSPAI